MKDQVKSILERHQGKHSAITRRELKEGMDKLRSYVIDECIVLRNYKVLGRQYLAGEKQGVLI